MTRAKLLEQLETLCLSERVCCSMFCRKHLPEMSRCWDLNSIVSSGSGLLGRLRVVHTEHSAVSLVGLTRERWVRATALYVLAIRRSDCTNVTG